MTKEKSLEEKEKTTFPNATNSTDLPPLNHKGENQLIKKNYHKTSIFDPELDNSEKKRAKFDETIPKLYKEPLLPKARKTRNHLQTQLQQHKVTKKSFIEKILKINFISKSPHHIKTRNIKQSSPKNGVKKISYENRTKDTQIFKPQKRKNLPKWQLVQNIVESNTDRKTQPQTQQTTNIIVKRYSSLEVLLLFLSFGLYWSYWCRRTLFELSFTLDINIDKKEFSYYKPFFKYIKYSKAIILMLQKAEKKYKIELIGLKSINMLILFPPLLIANIQKPLNNLSKYIDKKS